MKKQESDPRKKKKDYKKPLLTRYQKLTLVIGGEQSSAPILGCTRC